MKRVVSMLLVVLLAVCCIAVASAETAKITYCSWGNAEEKATEEAIVAAFMAANPDVEVEYIHVDGNYEEKLQIMIAGGEAPDVISIGGAHIPSFSSAFAPVDIAAVDTGKYIAPTLYESLVYDGQQYAYPKRVNTKVYAFNKDLLTKAGVAFPGAAYSIDQFTADAMAVAALGDDIYGSDPLWFGQWLYQFGGRMLEADGTVAFNSEVGKQAAQYIIDAVDKNAFVPTATEREGQDVMQWFIGGRVGFKGDFGPYFLPMMAQVTGFDWDVCAAPGNGGEMEIVGVGISAKTKNADAAQRLAAYISNADEAQAIIGGTSALPVTEAGKTVFLAQYPTKNLTAFFDAMGTQEIPPMIKGANQVGGILYGELFGRTKLGASGEEDVALVLDEAAAEVIDMLANIE